MRSGQRVIVLGAGIAGLCAAAAFRNSVDEVVLVERDPLDDEAEPAARRGVPQSQQLHNLLGAAQVNLEILLPGFLDGLVAAGGMRGRVSTDTHVHELGHRMPERDLGLAIICARRPLIDHTARRLALQDRRVQFRPQATASGLVIEGGAVRGAILNDAVTGGTVRMDADLVVDATGTGSSAAQWLGSAGYAVPEQAVRVDRWYATALYGRASDVPGPPRFWLIFPTPPRTRGGLVSPVDATTFSVSLNGTRRDVPPRTTAEFAAYARSLEDPVIGELLSDLVPVTAPTVFRRPLAVWRHFERMAALPRGFLPMGDAFATLNPLYGQGISVAARQGVELARLLAESNDLDELTRRHVHRAAGAVRQAWDLGALVDDRSGWGWAVDDRESATRLWHLLVTEPELHRTYVAAWHLLEPVTALTSLAGSGHPGSIGGERPGACTMGGDGVEP